MKLISRRVLRDYMKYRRVSIRELAEQCGVAKATIGHLHSGARDTCSSTTAAVIEESLNAPPGSLFVAHVVHGTGTVHQERKVA